jgi:hypothetical protein
MSEEIQKPVQGQEVKPVKTYTREEAIREIKHVLAVPIDPDYLIDQFRNQILPRLNGNKEEFEKAKVELMEMSRKLIVATGLNNHYHLAETIEEDNRPLILSLTQELIKEYDCKTVSEVSLAEMVAVHYGRVISYSKVLANNAQGGSKPITTERNGLYSFLSKEIDRASRQYIVALTMLRQFKNPPIEINVKAKTAFVSQNQQINNTQEIKTNDPQ